MKTESRYKKKLTTESCFHLHKILDSVAETFEDFFIQAHPQLLGTWCKNLVKTSTSSYDGETVTWEYTLDSDGYVSGVKRTDRDYYSYEYRWE